MIDIFCGHYGSGKTEVAINYILSREESEKTIVDLDIVNPYFRTNEAREHLEKHGVSVIAPLYANTNVDIPALPPEVAAAFLQRGCVVLDVGGDDGAICLGRFNSEINAAGYRLYVVVNTFRPETSDVSGIIEICKLISDVSRLKVGALVNNSNLMGDTTAEHVLSGAKIIGDAATFLGVPVAFTSSCVNADTDNFLPMTLYTRKYF